MQIVSTQKNIVISPKKVRPITEQVKFLTPTKALEVLPLVHKRGALYINKVIKSALANAKQKGVNPDELIIKEIQIGDAPRLKRGKPVSRGMGHSRLKRMSHIRIVLETKPQGTQSQMSKINSQNEKNKSNVNAKHNNKKKLIKNKNIIKKGGSSKLK